MKEVWRSDDCGAGYGTGSGTGYGDGSGNGDNFGARENVGWCSGIEDAYSDEEEQQFKNLKKVPPLITEIRRATR